MGVVNEHPDPNVRKLYAGQVAAEVGLPVADLVRVAEQRAAPPDASPSPRRAARRCAENAEFVAVALLAQDWDVDRRLAGRGAVRRRRPPPGVPRPRRRRRRPRRGASSTADPEAREVLERAAVADLDVDAEAEARNLIAAAVRRAARRSGPGRRRPGADPRRRRGPAAAGGAGHARSRPRRRRSGC